MNWLIGAIPGLVAMTAFLVFVRGYRMLRTDPAMDLGAEEVALLRGAEQQRSKGQSAITSLSYRLVPTLRKVLPPKALRWLQRQVDLAGRPDGLDVDSVLARSILWMMIISPAALIFVLQGNLLLLLLCVAVVIVLPLARLTATARKRREQIDADLPDFLDVLAVTVTAGIGFRTALATVAERFGGPLSHEIQLTLQQINNGATVRAAFVGLRSRAGSESVEDFVTAYLQAEELGAPLVDTLEHIAADMRKAHAQRLRQQAARVEPRVTLVVTVVMVPAILILFLGGLYFAVGGDQLKGLFGGS